MEDVVLHYKPGLNQDLPSLIETTEKLLALFPCRPPQVFTPWFPSIVDRHLPLRPARPPPIILSVQHLSTAAQTGVDPGLKENPNQDQDCTGSEGRPEQSCGSGGRGQTGPTQRRVNSLIRKPHPEIRFKPESPSKRCWTVFTDYSKGRTKNQTWVQTGVQASSRRFQQTVSKLRLHSRQRVKWIINENNCKDIEQVWRSLSRPPLGLSLPSCCNAHIDRSLTQVWIYCDLFQAEQVGLRLKHGLKLRGRISLWERRLDTFYSL